MVETFLSVAETAALLETSERTIQRNAMAGKYGEFRYVESTSGGGRGGKMLQIRLDALPESYQTKYIEEQGLGTNVKKVKTVSAYDQAPAWAREKAHRNHAILDAFESYLLRPGKKTELTEQFVREWNQEHLDETVSKTTLYRWKKGYQKDGLSALLPQYGQNSGKRFAISDELLTEFIRLLKKNLKIAECHRILELIAKKNGETCPSDATLRRIAKELPTAVLVAIQEGKKAFYNKCQTFTRRDPESVRAGQVFVGDHRKFDFFILGPRGTWVRPWVTAWMDMRSGKLVSWTVTFSPNTDTIMASFAEAALDPAIGLPREVYLDNGRDYCNERFAGRGFRERKAALEADKQRVVPMMERLGIITHFAIPENARAKTIERVAFLNMSNWFCPHMDTYCGRNTAHRPERLADKLKGDKNKAKYNITLEQLAEIFGGYVRYIYNKRPSERGRGREGECPDETFIRTRLPVRQTTEAVMQHFLQKQTGRYRVGRNGITFRGREYYSPEMTLHKKKDLLISCRQNDVSTIYVYDLDERPLFTATLMPLRDALHESPEGMHDDGSRKKAEWETVKNHWAYQAAESGDAPSMAEIVDLFREYGPQSPDPQPTTVTEMVPVPAELREAIRYNSANQATGTDGRSVFEMMHGTKIERRKGE
ncbi:Mu transposase C-terminal domain-containing protein [Propionispora vibrioides]|uniref:Mu DNA binding, I gamma subdomain n=1 Tax=Propionispora vibrioides TaxID=112903 RepID=A0A1H8U4C5_9FIRM|nr:Mu transposase C-terminal domain-containing protein [Propionispora vibrioides]SEO97693.1 Mu DNA binding, I gamma subdomain [Propionispora vibrioides]